MRNPQEFSQDPHLVRLRGTLKFQFLIVVSMVNALPSPRFKKHFLTGGSFANSKLSVGQTPRPT